MPTSCALLALALLSCASSAAEPDLKKSVVKFYTVLKRPNFYQPWEGGYQENSGGSGCAIEGNRILTNAHVVSNQVYLQVKKVGDTRKFTARLEHVAHDGELAIIRVDDPAFFEDTLPARFGELPRQRDKLAVYGFPIGGDELSITEGVVSRIEVSDYTHAQRNLLTIQTDAAINPGNSGGPVFQDGKLVGIAFQSFSGAGMENTGYAVPVPLIRRFLKDLDDGGYDGIPSLGVFWQKIESDSLRGFLRLRSEDGGVLVTRVVYGSSAGDALRENDVLLSVAGLKIAGDGSIPLRDSERVEFSHAVSGRQLGEPLQLGVLRGGERLSLSVTLKRPAGLVAKPQHDVVPPYFIFAGLVFVPLSYDYITVWGWEKAVPKFQYLYSEALPTEDRREIVVISQVLAHDANVGYHKLRDAVVRSVNGVPIRSLADVPRAFEKPPGRYHVIETDHFAGSGYKLDYWSDAGTRIVLSADKAAEATREVLSRYRIQSDRSPELGR